MNRTELTEQILVAKRTKGVSWKQIAETVGGASPVLITAALLGQMRLEKVQAEKAAAFLGLGPEGSAMLQEVPYRGSLPPGPPRTRSSIASTSSCRSTAPRGRSSSRRSSATGS
ncbi:MAG: hypothetical protein ACJ79C_18315 [Myxococcales bacterium]